MNKTFIVFGFLVAGAGPLTGCGVVQPPRTPPPTAGNALLQRTASGRHSWMLSSAKTDKLVYASNFPDNDVYVFSYATRQQVGLLTGFGYPYGLCVDRRGNLWIANQNPKELLEFPHGGTSPIATLPDPSSSAPTGCAIDPTTGNLAAANAGGNVVVYPKATGAPITYQFSNTAYLEYCAFDHSGNLFVSGEMGSEPLLLELQKNSKSITAVKFDGAASINSIQWHGSYLTVAMAEDYGQKLTTIAHVRVSNGAATVIGRTKLVNQHGPFNGQFWIDGSYIVGPTQGAAGNAGVLDLWKFPNGGRNKGKFESGGSYYVTLAGVAISPAH